jgi:hypothetical protein
MDLASIAPPLPRRYPSCVQLDFAGADTTAMGQSVRSAFPHGTTGQLVRSSREEVSAGLTRLATSPIEEDFFRAGDQMSESHDFSDLDEGYERPTMWRALIDWLRGETTATE